MKGTLIAVTGSAFALALPATAASPPPALRLLAQEPLIVRGVHFRPHERVRVTTRLDGAQRTKLVRSTTIGTFKVTFDVPVAFDPCVESLRVTAVGARGSDATLKLPQRACPPAP